MEYPKIETLFVRDAQSGQVIRDALRLAEFHIPVGWLLTEKIDGTNIRVHLKGDGTVEYGGRTDAAQLHASMTNWLLAHLAAPKIAEAFDPGTEAFLFGEGYGPKIQKGGGFYRGDGVNFRLFDVVVIGQDHRPWWLNWVEGVVEVARKLGIETVPVLGPPNQASVRDVVSVLQEDALESRVATAEGARGHKAEGIVARTEPMLFMRNGRRLMWKLKARDFPKGGR